jgi:hypothetical protein
LSGRAESAADDLFDLSVMEINARAKHRRPNIQWNAEFCNRRFKSSFEVHNPRAPEIREPLFSG